jgi:hypothetical protein
MATYQEIREWVKNHHGFKPKTCWIAHCKELHGLPLGTAPNRQGEERVEPCPSDKIAAIAQALRHFGMLP